MRAHVFNVDEETFPIHRDREFCGTGKIGAPIINYQEALEKKRTFSGIIADLLGTRPNDLVFFYEKGRGFHGVYQVIGPPFFDPQPIPGIGDSHGHVVDADLPFRLPIRCVDYFPTPVPEDLLFSTPAYERKFWILFYRKIQGARGCVTIDPDAAQSLLELLIKLNGSPTKHNFEPFYYDYELEGFHIPVSHEDETGDKSNLQLLTVPLVPQENVALEDYLRGWVVGHFDSVLYSDLRNIFGPSTHIEWFANNVPYHVAQRNIDILAYHRTPPGELINPSLRYRYSVIELKKDRAKPDAVDQVIGYSKWVANRLADGEVDIVKPFIIAASFQDEAIEQAKSVRFNQMGIQLIEYAVTNEHRICFSKVD